jgi:histone H3/H4
MKKQTQKKKTYNRKKEIESTLSSNDDTLSINTQKSIYKKPSPKSPIIGEDSTETESDLKEKKAQEEEMEILGEEMEEEKEILEEKEIMEEEEKEMEKTKKNKNSEKKIVKKRPKNQFLGRQEPNKELIGLNNSIPHSVMKRIIKDILLQNGDYKMSTEAAEVLHEAAEYHLTDIFYKTGFFCAKEKKQTISTKDLLTSVLISKPNGFGIHSHVNPFDYIDVEKRKKELIE